MVLIESISLLTTDTLYNFKGYVVGFVLSQVTSQGYSKHQMIPSHPYM